jgi:hypothetical protein
VRITPLCMLASRVSCSDLCMVHWLHMMAPLVCTEPIRNRLAIWSRLDHICPRGCNHQNSSAPPACFISNTACTRVTSTQALLAEGGAVASGVPETCWVLPRRLPDAVFSFSLTAPCAPAGPCGFQKESQVGILTRQACSTCGLHFLILRSLVLPGPRVVVSY